MAVQLHTRRSVEGGSGSTLEPLPKNPDPNVVLDPDDAGWTQFSGPKDGEKVSAEGSQSAREVLSGKRLTLPGVPTQLYIGGEWRTPVEGGSFKVRNPSTERILHHCPSATKADVDLAVAAARDAFDSGVWSKKSGAERGDFLQAIADGLRAARQELAELETKDNGKPIGESLGDVDASIACFEYYAGLARDLDAQQFAPLESSNPSYEVRLRKEPIGVAAAVTPWNYPLLMAAWKVAPALAAGCTMVLKPSEVTPLTALKLAEVADQAGLPAGVLNVIPGLGSEAGRALTQHPGVDKLAFTGGTKTGSMIMQAAAERVTPVTLELGGKSAAIVFDDADLDRVTDWILYGGFGNQGEICSATSRVLVHASLADELERRLVEGAKKIRVGDGMGEDVQMGPLVSKEHYRKVVDMVRSGRKQGAKLLTGGKRPKGQKKGYFLEPTIFTNVKDDMKIWREEIFGPVLSIMTFETEAEAVRLANDSDYGLAAAVMSTDDAKADRVAAELEAGIVWINASQPTVIEAPWGGFKKSGIGRELGTWGLDNYLQVKQVTKHVAEAPFEW